MKKVLVIGCAGAGKSTFARKLSEKTGLPLYYLDMIWHKADRTTVSTEEFDATLSEIMNKDQWILDGNYLRTMPLRLEKPIPFSSSIYHSMSAFLERLNGSVRSEWICHGKMMSLTMISVSGFWIFRKTIAGNQPAS